MRGAADTHSWEEPKAQTGQEILSTQSERLIRNSQESEIYCAGTGEEGVKTHEPMYKPSLYPDQMPNIPPTNPLTSD